MKQRRKFWQVVEKIQSLINEGVYPPESLLPDERELAQSFEVSLLTIRDAIVALEVMEVVESKTSKKVLVLRPSPKSSGDNNDNISALELVQARALIEGEAAALAAKSITDAELADLKEALNQIKNNENIAQADMNFHMIISKATKNSAIHYAVKRFWTLRNDHEEIEKVCDTVCGKFSYDIHDEHKKIYLAIANGDSREARRTMHEHFNRLINPLFELVEEARLVQLRKEAEQNRASYSLTHLYSNA
jgi:DNA-binding FadR family transcriptional regulator